MPVVRVTAEGGLEGILLCSRERGVSLVRGKGASEVRSGATS